MADRYPDAPGAKGSDGTSQAAAEAIAPAVRHLRLIAMRALDQLGDATPLEAIACTDLPRESLQPRFSELKEMGLVEVTGMRRRTPSGKFAAVLRLTPEGRKVLQ